MMKNIIKSIKEKRQEEKCEKVNYRIHQSVITTIDDCINIPRTRADIEFAYRRIYSGVLDMYNDITNKYCYFLTRWGHVIEKEDGSFIIEEPTLKCILKKKA